MVLGAALIDLVVPLTPGTRVLLLVVAVSVFWFEVPLKGSLLTLLGGSAVYLLCTLGLGLFVSRKIIEAHGGRIGVESEVGQGSRFFFELPILAGLPVW